jgi:hypothetical protein
MSKFILRSLVTALGAVVSAGTTKGKPDRLKVRHSSVAANYFKRKSSLRRMEILPAGSA